MNQILVPTINYFRSAQELSSSVPAQLKRTIAELEARIIEQDSLIAGQNERIKNLSQKLQQKKEELHAIEKMSSKPGQGLDEALEDLKKEKLEKTNKNMEALI